MSEQQTAKPGRLARGLPVLARLLDSASDAMAHRAGSR
jgi:hypothetical protein